MGRTRRPLRAEVNELPNLAAFVGEIHPHIARNRSR